MDSPIGRMPHYDVFARDPRCRQIDPLTNGTSSPTVNLGIGVTLWRPVITITPTTIFLVSHG